VHELSAQIVGKDPRDVERIWQTLYRGGFYRGGPVLTSALSGIDQALWGHQGKALGVPVYELPAGASATKWKSTADRLQYAEEAARCALEKKNLGFRAVKMFGVDAVGGLRTIRRLTRSAENCRPSARRSETTSVSPSTSTDVPTKRWQKRCSRNWSRTVFCLWKSGAD
jgi:galactonate dehydratase